jgi:pimeloyl-ACP methyl ester carboxylesterase
MKSKTLLSGLPEGATRLSRPALFALAASAAGTAGLAGVNAVRARRATQAHPPLGEFVEIDGVRLHYLAKGNGATIVLLHGNGTMIQDWSASGVLGELAKTNRVVAFDRPGFGHSERPRSTIWTPSAQARLIAQALDSLGEDQVTVVAHSFGTLVALALASERPELVSSLVLISGYYYPTARVDVAFAAPPAVPVIGDVMRYTVSPLLGAALKPAAEKQMFAPAKVPAKWRTKFPFEMTLRPSQIRASAADAALIVPAAASAAAGYPRLDVPVTIIAGEGDLVVNPEAHSSRLAGEIKGSELLLVSDAGHMVHHTASAQIVEAVKARVEAAA